MGLANYVLQNLTQILSRAGSCIYSNFIFIHFRSDAAALGGANYILQNLTQILSRASGFSPLTHHLARLRGEAIASGRANAYTSLRVSIVTTST